MSAYNSLFTDATCPACGCRSEVQADFRFGLRDQLDYRLGEKMRWNGKGLRTPAMRPLNGDFSGEAYTECPCCGRDFWLLVEVESDVILRAETDWERDDYGRSDDST